MPPKASRKYKYKYKKTSYIKFKENLPPRLNILILKGVPKKTKE